MMFPKRDCSSTVAKRLVTTNCYRYYSPGPQNNDEPLEA
jgi:hypothetical protein